MKPESAKRKRSVSPAQDNSAPATHKHHHQNHFYFQKIDNILEDVFAGTADPKASILFVGVLQKVATELASGNAAREGTTGEGAPVAHNPQHHNYFYWQTVHNIMDDKSDGTVDPKASKSLASLLQKVATELKEVSVNAAREGAPAAHNHFCWHKVHKNLEDVFDGTVDPKVSKSFVGFLQNVATELTEVSGNATKEGTIREGAPAAYNPHHLKNFCWKRVHSILEDVFDGTVDPKACVFFVGILRKVATDFIEVSGNEAREGTTGGNHFVTARGNHFVIKSERNTYRKPIQKAMSKDSELKLLYGGTKRLKIEGNGTQKRELKEEYQDSTHYS